MRQIEKWVTVAHNKINHQQRSGRKAAYLQNPDVLLQDFEEQTQRT